MPHLIKNEYLFWCMECECICTHWLVDLEIECMRCHERTPVVPFITMLSAEIHRREAAVDSGGALDE